MWVWFRLGLCERELVGLVQTGVYVRGAGAGGFGSDWCLCERAGGFGSDWCLCERAGAGGFGSDWCLCERAGAGGLVQTGVYVRECWWVWFRLVFM